MAFGITEPLHGSDATGWKITPKSDADDWIIKRCQAIQTRRSTCHPRSDLRSPVRRTGKAQGITSFLVPNDTAPGFQVQYYWAFTCQPITARSLTDARAGLPADAVLGRRSIVVGGRPQKFLHENRIRQGRQ